LPDRHTSEEYTFEYRLVRMLCCFIFFLMPLSTWGSPAHPELAPITTAILTLCGDCQVLVLGETHQKLESPVLFIDLVTHLIAQGERVLVGLEILADQQDALDAVLVGNRTPEGIAHPIIDSPAFQNMLVELSALSRTHEQLVTIAANDARDHERVRDAAMATHIRTHLASGQLDRTVVLVGNLHTIRKIHWAEDAGSQTPFLAERLVEAGVHITSVMQDLDTACGGLKHPTFYPVRDRNGLAAVRRQVDTIKHHPAMDMRQAADGVVVWQCHAETVDAEAER
jgi:hypothetical protein